MSAVYYDASESNRRPLSGTPYRIRLRTGRERANNTGPKVLYGRHAVLERIKSRETFEKIFLLQSQAASGSLSAIRRMAQEEGIPILFAPKEKLEKLCGNQNHQGVVGIISAHDYADANDILETALREKRIVLALDHLEDPQNLGSLLRTGDAVGIAGVIVAKRRAAGLTAGAAKASAGAIQHVKVARVANLHQTLLQLKKKGFTLIGADQSAENDYRSLAYTHPLALVLGSEHEGLRYLIRNTCDFLARIPMRGHLDSLNVSVAGALILYEAFLQQGKTPDERKNRI